MLRVSTLTSSMLRISIAAALAVAALAAMASPSLAGTYQVTSCNASPDHATNNAWVAGATPATISLSQTCPPSGSRSGLLAQDVLLAGDTPNGQSGLWTFTAPVGTTITAIAYDRWTGLHNGDGWNPRLRLSDGTEFDSCTIAFGDSDCSVGSAPAGSGGQISRTGLSATSLTWGLACAAPGQCPGGGTLHAAWAALYGSTVTITDNVSPTMGAASGALTSTSGYRRGSVSGTLSATDATGIKQTSVVVDGTAYDATGRACDFTFAVPCSNLTAATVTLNSAAIADGSHTVRLAAQDAAGNESLTSPVTMTFDNTAPAAPTALTVAGGASKTTNSFDVSWANPGGQVSPLTTVHYRIGAGAEQTVPLTTSLTGLTLPGAGSDPLSVWLEDEAGNATQANAATATLTYTAPSTGGGGGGGGGGFGGGGSGGTKPPTTDPTPTPEPTPTPTPTTPSVPTVPVTPPQDPPTTSPVLQLSTPSLTRGTLRLSGTIAKQATGRVTITYTARVHGRKQSQKTTARLRNGRYSVRLRLRGALAKTTRGTVTVTYAGNAQVKAGRTHKTVTRHR